MTLTGAVLFQQRKWKIMTLMVLCCCSFFKGRKTGGIMTHLRCVVAAFSKDRESGGI